MSEHTGKVKWFNVTKGYGFIMPETGGGEDVFVHMKKLQESGISTLVENQKVHFELEETRDRHTGATRISATNIRVEG